MVKTVLLNTHFLVCSINLATWSNIKKEIVIKVSFKLIKISIIILIIFSPFALKNHITIYFRIGIFFKSSIFNIVL